MFQLSNSEEEVDDCVSVRNVNCTVAVEVSAAVVVFSLVVAKNDVDDDVSVAYVNLTVVVYITSLVSGLSTLSHGVVEVTTGNTEVNYALTISNAIRKGLALNVSHNFASIFL